MTSLVMDTSIAVAALLPDRQSEVARRILLRVADEGAVVPAVWHLEIGNILQASEKARFLDEAAHEAVLEHLAALPITVDGETGTRAWGDTLRLARTYGLSLHDAAYLELALRRRLILATFDAALLRAATVAGAVGKADM